jgi:hypothetical protein
VWYQRAEQLSVKWVGELFENKKNELLELKNNKNLLLIYVAL